MKDETAMKSSDASPTMTLSPADVRAILLAVQGLTGALPVAPTQADVLATIRRLHVLQIDTIHVIARSPYFVLWSRLGDYDPRGLDALLSEGALFEYWAHAACFLPIEDYPLYRRLMLNKFKGEGDTHAERWIAEHQSVADGILAHIEQLGAARSADFERKDGVKGTWWNWKEEKLALENLFYIGELMIAARQKFQRVYDLRRRILPDWDDQQAPPLSTVYETFVLNTVAALGVTQAAWVADYFRMKKADALPILRRLTAEGRLLQVKVEGWQDAAYLHPDHLALAQRVANGERPQARTNLLSPFDPIVWDRERARVLFNFDYRIECYTPAPKRQYGYFTLPILYNNALIGRLDPKAHRKDGIFEVKALHLEPDVIVTDHLLAELKQTLQACANWHQTPQVVIRQSDPSDLAAQLQQLF